VERALVRGIFTEFAQDFPQNLRSTIAAKKESEFCPRHPDITQEKKRTRPHELI
jgi:hypothetical protein